VFGRDWIIERRRLQMAFMTRILGLLAAILLLGTGVRAAP
jgi:hypothetical protein